MADHASSVTGFSLAEPAEEGFDPDKLGKAVIFARDLAETPWPRDLSKGLAASGASEPPPWNGIIGRLMP